MKCVFKFNTRFLKEGRVTYLFKCQITHAHNTPYTYYTGWAEISHEDFWEGKQ